MHILVVQSGLRTFREKQKVHDVGLEKGGGRVTRGKQVGVDLV